MIVADASVIMAWLLGLEIGSSYQLISMFMFPI